MGPLVPADLAALSALRVLAGAEDSQDGSEGPLGRGFGGQRWTPPTPPMQPSGTRQRDKKCARAQVGLRKEADGAPSEQHQVSRLREEAAEFVPAAAEQNHVDILSRARGEGAQRRELSKGRPNARALESGYSSYCCEEKMGAQWEGGAVPGLCVRDG